MEHTSVKTKELYRIPRNTYIRVGESVLLFDHLDGMYSFCTDKDGNVHHIAAWAEVEIVDGFDSIFNSATK
jgi:hypothetical protein